MSDYRQQQEQDEQRQWMAQFESALKSDDDKAMQEAASKLQEYMDGRLQGNQ